MSPSLVARTGLVVPVSLWLLLLIGGCPAPPAELGPIVTGNIDPGIYTGQLTSQIDFFRNGVLVDQSSSTQPYNEVVDQNGIPLVQPEGVPPRRNYSSSRTIGGFSTSYVITSVSAIGNRVVLVYEVEYLVENIQVAGTGTWTYEFVPPSTLRVTVVENALSEPVDFNSVAFRLTATATLSTDANSTDDTGRPLPSAGGTPAGPVEVTGPGFSVTLPTNSEEVAIDPVAGAEFSAGYGGPNGEVYAISVQPFGVGGAEVSIPYRFRGMYRTASGDLLVRAAFEAGGIDFDSLIGMLPSRSAFVISTDSEAPDLVFNSVEIDGDGEAINDPRPGHHQVLATVDDLILLLDGRAFELNNDADRVRIREWFESDYVVVNPAVDFAGDFHIARVGEWFSIFIDYLSDYELVSVQVTDVGSFGSTVSLSNGTAWFTSDGDVGAWNIGDQVAVLRREFGSSVDLVNLRRRWTVFAIPD